MEQHKNSPVELSGTFAVLLCAGVVCAELTCFHEVNFMSYTCFADNSCSVFIQTCFILLFESFLLLGKKIPYRELTKAFLIWVPAVFFLFFPSLFHFPVAVLCSGVSAYRVFTLTAQYGILSRKKIFPDENSKCWFFASVFLTAAAIITAFAVSCTALKVMYLCFSDWGIFAEIADNTWKGHFMYSFWQRERCFLSDHFMPSFYLFFLPLWYCFPHPGTVFALGALFLFGSGLLVYRYCRIRGGSREEGFLALCIWLLLPSLANMNLSVFYGFHVVYFFIPVYLLYAIVKDSGHKKWAFAVFLFSLGIKETVPLIWMGISIFQVLSSKSEWKKALLYFGIAMLYEIFVLKFAIPFFAPGNEENFYMDQFSRLGGSFGEILLSPVLRFRTFWGTLFHGYNLLFLFLLCVPLFPLVIRKPVLIPAAFPALCLSMLRNNAELNSVYLHHQTEAVVVLAVISFSALYDSKTRILPADTGGKRKILLLSAVVCALLSHALWGQSPFSRENTAHIFRMENLTEVMQNIRKVIPVNAEVSTTEHIAPHLLGHCRLFWLEKEKEYLLLDTGDKFVRKNSDTISAILARGAYTPVCRAATAKHCFILFRKTAGASEKRIQENTEGNFKSPEKTGKKKALFPKTVGVIWSGVP